MKKRVLITISLMIVLGTFFSFNVFASGTAQLRPVAYKSTSVTVNGVNIDAYCTQFYPYDDADQYGVTELNNSLLSLNVVFTNNTSVYKYVAYTNLKVMMYYPESTNTALYDGILSTGIISIENFSDDLYIVTENSNNYLEVRPDGDWAFRNGFVVPPNTRLNAIANIKIPGHNGQNNVIAYSTISSIAFAYNPTVSDTEFVPHGDNTDLQIQLDSIRQSMIEANVNLEDVITYLSDIKTILEANTNTNTSITNDSNSLKSTSDNVHSREQAYFTQNAQAIQATGLGNYQIGTVEGNGIGAVSTDFTTIWNALSGWNSVYIFSLTLGLALTILRHAPNAISRRQRRKQE